MVHGEKGSLVFWEAKEGSIMPEHRHPHEQITCVLEGELDMQVGGVRMHLIPGSVHVIPPQVPHSAIALSDCRIIDSFSPVREDYR